MKIILYGALLLLSVVLAISVEEEKVEFVPESEYDGSVVDPATGKRTKRYASLAFLTGVAAGGIFGPILYNRLYGWGRSRPRLITFTKGWRPAESGWQEESSGWQQSNSGWQEESTGWQQEQPKGWQQPSKGWQPVVARGWQSGNRW